MKRPHLIFIPGWGMEPSVWSPLAAELGKRNAMSFAEWRSLRSAEEIPKRVGAPFAARPDRSFILIGWSLGALSAIETALASPSRVERMILIGGTARFTSDDGYEAGWDPRIVRRMKRRLVSDREGTLLDFYAMMFSRSERKEGKQKQWLRSINFQRNETDSLLFGLDYLLNRDFRDRLRQIQCPLLLIHGAEDRICPPEAAEYIARYTRGPAELQFLARTGHIPFFTRPDECFARINEFIEKGDADD